jgi:hypothetical protein
MGSRATTALGGQRSPREQGTIQWMAPEVVGAGWRGSAASPPLAFGAGGGGGGGGGAWGSGGGGEDEGGSGDGWGVRAWQKADVWSLGCTVLELLTGRPPWHGVADDPAEVMLHLAATDLRIRIPRFASAAAREFLAATLEPNPAARPTMESLIGHPFVCSLLSQEEEAVIEAAVAEASAAAAAATAAALAGGTHSSLASRISRARTLVSRGGFGAADGRKDGVGALAEGEHGAAALARGGAGSAEGKGGDDGEDEGAEENGDESFAEEEDGEEDDG